MPAAPEKIAETIRELRHDLGLTQVQLAAEVGITPTSIYRYEAGNSTPETATLVAFWHVALTKGSLAAAKFSDILVELVEPLGPMIAAMSAVQGNLADAISTDLTSDERVTTLALVKFLRSSPERTLQKIVETILEPFINEVKLDFAKQLQDKTARASSNKKGSENVVSKSPRSNKSPD